MRTTVIRGTAAAVLLSATVLGLAGCVNAEKPAAPGAGDSQSFGAPPTTTTTTPPVSSSSASSSSVSPTSSGGTTQTADKHNATDVTFATQAVLLRQQALTMATLAGADSTNAQVKALATKIKNDAVPVPAQLTTWLQGWGQTVPSADSAKLPGVLTSSQMSQLTSAKGTAFDMHWLQYMKANLQAAKDATAKEQSNGAFQQAKQMAQQWAGVAKTELNTANGIG